MKIGDENLLIIDFENIESVDALTTRFKGSLVKHPCFSGNYSAKLADTYIPVEIKLKVVTKKIYKISYWRKGAANLHVVLKGKGGSVRFNESVGTKKKNGWDKIELLVNTVWCKDSSDLIIKIKQRKNKSTLIDDLRVEIVGEGKADYNFEMSNGSIDKVVKSRGGAYNSSYVLPEFKNKIKAKLNGDDVTIRLKGDWKDHISKGVWSFKTHSESSISKGAQTVTFQNVKTRNFLKEWVFMNLCKKADIVTPNYDVVTVSINNSSPYVCALEESFSDDFILRKTKFDAPVLRLYEDFLFPHWVKRWPDKTLYMPELENSYIYAYDGKKYKSKKYSPLFKNHANKLLQLIKNDSIINLIDIEKWAIFFAIQRLTKSYHNLAWHNTRWFVNEKGLIEPIAYDGNTLNEETERWFGEGKFGQLDAYIDRAPSVALSFMNKLFMNEAFTVAFKKQLEKYSDATFLKKELDELSPELITSQSKIGQFYDYNFTTDYLFKSAEKLRENIVKIDNSKWIGNEDVFNVSFSVGEIPKDEIYLKNLVRGYLSEGMITFVNGINEEVVIRRKTESEDFLIGANSSILVKNKLAEKWITVFEGNEIEIDVTPWIPLN